MKLECSVYDCLQLFVINRMHDLKCKLLVVISKEEEKKTNNKAWRDWCKCSADAWVLLRISSMITL